MGKRISGLLFLLLLTATACHRRVIVETVEHTVVVHDTVRIEPEPIVNHQLDWVIDSAMSVFPELFSRSHVGLCIVDIDQKRILTTRNERNRMRTASVMKAVTAITALSTVQCHDSAFLTRVMTDGKKAWVRGGWDPLLSQDDVARLARQARTNMPKDIAGIPAVDMSGQDATHYGRGWCWDDHNPLLTPLFYAPTIETRKRRPIERPEQDFVDAFARSWRKAPAGKAAKQSSNVLASVSRPMAEVLAPMLKNSDNLMAEAVWRLTGETEKERQVALAHVAAMAGVGNGELQQADGSGLSLYNYASPLSLVKLLFWADKQEFAPVLHQCLSCMGVDGTLKNRRVHGARIEAKTGTVEGVITLAGYMSLTNGRRLVFSVMMNGVEDKGQARSATDFILERVSEALQ